MVSRSGGDVCGVLMQTVSEISVAVTQPPRDATLAAATASGQRVSQMGFALTLGI
jgi:hypothetical protein